MASAHTMPNPQGRNLLVPPEQLNIQGRGLSPQPINDTTMLSVSSVRSSVSEDDEELSQQSEEYTVLDGVREMNHILVRQIETLRLKIQVDEKNSDKDKARLREEKEKELRIRETEIDDLKDSLYNRDERIQGLVKAGHEKDRQIKSKSQEIETLKELVHQSEEYARKLQKQISRVVSDRGRLEDDPLYQKQNEEMVKLTEELETLRERLASMELELQRAMKIIDMQNQKMKSIIEEKSLIHAKFKEDLDRVSRAMRQEVERMREVMRQNYEEMRNLREENKQMHDDVRDIKEMLKATRLAGGAQNSDHLEVITGHQRPITAHSSSLYTKSQHGQTKAVHPKGPGSMIGGNIAQAPSMRPQRRLASRDPDMSKSFHGSQRENTQIMSRQGQSNFRSSNPVSNNHNTKSQNTATNSSSAVRSSLDTSRSNLSPDTSARTVVNHIQGSTSRGNHHFHGDNPTGNDRHPNMPQHNAGDGNDVRNFPPICTMKDGTNLTGKRPTSRPAAKSAIRKGSAVRML